ncbi:MAG: hypothetical protein IT280_02795 [Ignavibacteria bacterium]|nr:hypothetical protein [Ignavibacteria bacterium]
MKKYKFIKIGILFTFLVIFYCQESSFAQQFINVNFPIGSVSGIESRITLNLNYRIYQVSQNVIKFELPAVSLVKIGFYDSNNNLVRTYLYNNLQAGSYEININSANLEKGIYTCILSTANVHESSKIIIE